MLRTTGGMLGKLVGKNSEVDFRDPNKENLVANVSIETPVRYGDGKKRVAVIDCGCKNNIIRSLLQRDLSVTVVPWNWPLEERVV